MHIHQSRGESGGLPTIRAGRLAAMAVMVVLGISRPVQAQGAAAAAGPPPGTVRVTGEATVSAKPDLAELDIGVFSQASTAGAAAAENAQKMERVVTALKKEVGPGGEVRTASYTVGPRYGEPRPGQQRPVVVGYTVTNLVRVRTTQVGAIGRLVDSAVKLGANDVQRVSFGLKDPTPIHSEALKAAAVKARAHATALAGALGLRIKAVVSLSDGDPGPWPVREYADTAAFRRQAVETPVEAGSLDVKATVTAVFSVEPAAR